MKNSYLKLTLFLAVIAALATGVLAGVNLLTKDMIAEQQAGAQTAELKKLYPDATSFKPIEFTADANGAVMEAYQVDDTAYVFKAKASGYADDIIILIGYDKDGTNSRLAFLQNKETAGYGAELNKEEWLSKAQGLKAADEIPARTGATVSSNAVREAASGAIEVLAQVAGLDVEAPIIKEPEKPVLKLVDPDDSFEGALREVAHDEASNEYTYIVVGPGYKQEVMQESAVNRFEVVIDGSTNKIKSVKNLSNNDSEGISDAAVAQSYLDTFVGLDIKDENAEVDAATGATVTSKSVMRAIRAAVKAYEDGAEPTDPSDKPKETEPEKPKATAIILVDAADTFVGELKEESHDEATNVYKYIVVAPGYKQEVMQESAFNRFEIEIDGNTGKIKSVKNISNNDTEGISDKAVSEDYLATFVGLDLNDEASEVDAASGATVTSKSVMRAIRVAAEHYKNK